MEIVLSSIAGPPHIVASHQTISGKVTFLNNQDRPTVFVTISLVGKSEVAFTKGKSVYQGRATLFAISQTLHDGPLVKKDFEWPFEFTFPKVTDGEEKKWKAIPPFQVTEGHQLPPSMVFDMEDFDQNSGKGGVIYILQAKFSKSLNSSAFSSSETARINLYYLPYRQSETPALKIALVGKETFHCSSKLLDPAREKPKSFFKRMKTPTSTFEVAITAPQVVYDGCPLPIILSLTHDLQNSTAPGVPIVRLTSCIITLTRMIYVAGRAIFEDDAKFLAGELLLKKEGLDIALSESQNLAELLSVPTFRTKYGLTFATYNLVQAFKFMVKVTLECVDKRFWTELRSKNIVVLSPFTRERLENGGRDPASVLLGMHSISDDDDIEAAVVSGMDLLVSSIGIGISAGFL
jgi:hypothetical protein